MSVNPGEKEVSVGILGSDDYFNTVKSPVEELIIDILQSRKYDAYSVKVSKAEIYTEPTLDDKERMSENIIIKDVVVEVLQKYGITSPDWPQIKNTELELQIPNTVTNIDEMKTEIIEILEEKEMGAYSIKVNVFDPEKRERDARWSDIIWTITEGLTANKEYKVKTVGYSNKLDSITISIDTNIALSESNKDEVVTKIEKSVQSFLNEEKIKNIIKNDQYEVLIYSKDGKVIN